MGNVESGKAHPLCCGYEFGQCLGSKAEVSKINQSIDVAQALGSTLTLVQRRGQRLLDTGADQADDEGAL